MNKPKIIAYLKPQCGWSNGVRAVLRKYDLPYEDRDIINAYMLANNLVEPTTRAAGVPTNAPCDSHDPEPAPLQFRR
jgi:monothiol glutaredoxin